MRAASTASNGCPSLTTSACPIRTSLAVRMPWVFSGAEARR